MTYSRWLWSRCYISSVCCQWSGRRGWYMSDRCGNARSRSLEGLSATRQWQYKLGSTKRKHWIASNFLAFVRILHTSVLLIQSITLSRIASYPGSLFTIATSRWRELTVFWTFHVETLHKKVQFNTFTHTHTFRSLKGCRIRPKGNRHFFSRSWLDGIAESVQRKILNIRTYAWVQVY